MLCVQSGNDFEPPSTRIFVTSQCSFCFEMPQSIMPPSMSNDTDTQHEFQPLPPSIRIVQAASKKPSITSDSPKPTVCDITYYIETWLFLNGHVACQAIREIMVMPVAETPPPIGPGDLRNEYRFFSSSQLGISWRRRHTPLEPQPLLFKSPSIKEASQQPSCCLASQLESYSSAMALGI